MTTLPMMNASPFGSEVAAAETDMNIGEEFIAAVRLCRKLMDERDELAELLCWLAIEGSGAHWRSPNGKRILAILIEKDSSQP